MNKAVIVAVVAVLGGAVAYMLIGKPPEKIEKAEVPSEGVNAITIAVPSFSQEAQLAHLVFRQ